MGWDDGVGLIDWCEPNHAISPSIAEFWNTVSNAPYVVVGGLTFWCLRDSAVYFRLRICGVMLALIGFGSTAFHGTLTRWGQAADELAILYWEVALLFCVFEQELKRDRRGSLCICALFAVENFAYSLMDTQPTLGWALYHPLHACVDVVLVRKLWLQTQDSPQIQRYIKLGVTSIFLALVCWLLDMFACDAVQAYYLHAFGWHFLSCAAITYMHLAVALMLCRQHGHMELALKMPGGAYVRFSVDATDESKLE